MGYRYRTPRLGIPYPGLGDEYDLSEEQRANEIIDTQLSGAVKYNSGGHGIVREGIFNYVLEGDGSYTINLNADNSNNYPAIEAFINQIYVQSQSSIIWNGLQDNTTYYLFIQLVETNDLSSLQNGNLIPTYSTSPSIPTDGLLVGLVSIIGGNVTISTDVPGKVLLPRLDDHIATTKNPHGPALEQDDIQVSGIEVVNSGIFAGVLEVTGDAFFNGRSTFSTPVIVASGITIDEVDVSTLKPLINGSNADGMHTHDVTSGLPSFELFAYAPRRGDTVESGVDVFMSTIGSFSPSRIDTVRDSNRNAYRYTAGYTGMNVSIVTSSAVPGDFGQWSGIQLHYRTTSGLVDSLINFSMYDRDGTEIGVINGTELRSDDWAIADITISGGQFASGDIFESITEMRGTSGVPVYTGDLLFRYYPQV
jgi:hypothetical protein